VVSNRLRNQTATAGLICSAIGVIGLSLFFISGLSIWIVPLAFVLTMLSVPGLVISVLALWLATDKRRAKWGAGLGLLGCLYVPTILVFAMRAFHEGF
jgi:hypothetical protein